MSDLGLRDLISSRAIVGIPKAGKRRVWTNHEEKILKENFSSLGVGACLALLPGRSAGSIYQHASTMGLRSPVNAKKKGYFRQRWTSNDQIDAVIVRCYEGNPKYNQINDLARAVARPRWWVSKRAAKLGLIVPRFKEPPWTEEEVELASAHAHKDPSTIKRIFERHGYKRTETAITVKLKRGGTGTGRNADPNHFTATALSKLFGIDGKSITRWIANGLLKAERRGTDRTSQQGGDEWWIHRKHIRTFVVANVNAVDFRKVDKFWLVDLLTN